MPTQPVPVEARVIAVRKMVSVSVTVSLALFIASWLAVDSRAQAPEKSPLGGAWTINKDLSDQPSGRSERTERSADSGGGSQRQRGGRGMGRGGGGYRGGFGGQGAGGGGNGAPQMNPDDAARLRDAMRDITNPPDHLVIVQTDSMVILTGPDGRTTRLAPDGKKVKDENTKIERKTKWDGAKLVSEINGAGPGKLTQTFEVDADHHLKISLLAEGGGQPRTTLQVYDSDALTK
jgi:hypothetical protein